MQTLLNEPLEFPIRTNRSRFINHRQQVQTNIYQQLHTTFSKVLFARLAAAQLV